MFKKPPPLQNITIWVNDNARQRCDLNILKQNFLKATTKRTFSSIFKHHGHSRDIYTILKQKILSNLECTHSPFYSTLVKLLKFLKC